MKAAGFEPATSALVIQIYSKWFNKNIIIYFSLINAAGYNLPTKYHRFNIKIFHYQYYIIILIIIIEKNEWINKLL